jgi:hypothetical protein
VILVRHSVLALAALALCGFRDADAQSGSVSSGPVLLQIRPRAGDTLRLHFDQTVEMRGTARAGGTDSTSHQKTKLEVFTRIAVETTDIEGATVVALTDSVNLTGAASAAGATMLPTARAMKGQRVRLRVLHDGAMHLANQESWTPREVGTVLAQLPAALPRHAVASGSTWTRDIAIPVSGSIEARGNAELKATFRLDSLTRDGDLAFISLTGRLTRSDVAPSSGYASVVSWSGTVTGQLTVDRRRGWITDARTVIVVRSLVHPRSNRATPVRVETRITQSLRVE